MQRLWMGLAAAGVLTAAGAAIAQQAAAQGAGYLGAAAPDTSKILPPAPVPGTTRWEADRTVFLSTRRLKDSPRWKLAQNDVDQRAIVKDMTCALGVELTPQNAPRTAALVTRMGPDVSLATNRPKDLYKRPRPYLSDEGPICVEKTKGLADSPDYPSGHVAWGWTVGLVLAEIVPDRAAEILARARAFGESRLVCGVHTLSAVESGRTNASILVAALHANPAFRADLEAARAEIAAARARGAGLARDCAAEAAALAG